ncbi:MAG: prephenate dehydratase [Thaumarchaeota archaeon]|nr:prephenate dehydratase [Nitrososphaerota archaeon]
MPRKDNRGKIAFQGERGAYSEAAAYKYFGPSTELLPLRTLSEVFHAVEEREVRSAIVPVENSLEGSVSETYDLLRTTNVKVRGEVNLRIVHCLIARPNVALKDVKIVYSHPQALGQTRQFIEKRHLTPQPTYDTAGSVMMLKEASKSVAAIASAHAAEIYGMKVLKKGIEDNHNNYTRFFILSLRDAPKTGSDKTSIIFSAKHIPGSLYRILGEFAKRNLNLTKIESRPTRRTPWEYNFYLDFEGHRTDKKCVDALKQVQKKTVFLKVIGSYPKAEL